MGDREGASCQVTVRTPGGDPVPKFCLRVVGPDLRHVAFTRTDESGRGTLRPLPAVPLSILGYRPGTPPFVIAKLRPELRSRLEIETVVPVSGALRLVVTDRRSRPAAGLAVDVRADAPPPLDRILVSGFLQEVWWTGKLFRRLSAEQALMTDTDGTLDVGPLTPGRYLVKVGTVERVVTITPGETTQLAIAASR